MGIENGRVTAPPLQQGVGVNPVPPYTPAEQRSRETFLALMHALSYPGRAYPLPDDAPPLPLIGEALLDLETSFYTPDNALADVLAANGARRLAPESAAYHVYPSLSDADWEAIEAAGVGTLLYPDHAATLIIGGSIFDHGDTQTWTGPGVNGLITVTIALPARFWAIREARRRYPLGWDAFLISDDGRVIGLPRSTTITRGGM